MKKILNTFLFFVIIFFVGSINTANACTVPDAFGNCPGDTGFDSSTAGGNTSANSTNSTVSSTDTNIDTSTNNVLGLTTADLRAGNVNINTIPQVIVSVIQNLLAIAGTVAIFSLIYHAVRMQISSGITGDSSGVDHAKKGMIGSLIGFIIAIAAWFLVTRAVDLLAAMT